MVDQITVGADGHQTAALRQPFQRVAQVFTGHTLDLARTCQQGVEGAIFLQPLGGRLRAHLGDPGHVVHGVANQRLVVHHQRRGHTKFGSHTGHVTHLATHGVDDGDVFVHQLAQVLVATGDDDLGALSRCHNRQRANDVIGLHAGHHHHRPAQQPHHFVDRVDLAAQLVGHGRAIGFVGGVPLVTEGRALGVENTDSVVGRHFAAQAGHHVDHDADGTGFLHRSIGQSGAHGFATGKKGTVQIAGAVYQQQGLLGHPRIVPCGRYTPRLRGLRSATPSPLQGATQAAWQSQFRRVCWRGSCVLPTTGICKRGLFMPAPTIGTCLRPCFHPCAALCP